MPRHYTDEEKRLVLDRLIANHGDVARTADEFHLTTTTIYRWMKAANVENEVQLQLQQLQQMQHFQHSSPPSLAGEGQGVGVSDRPGVRVSDIPEEITDRLTTLRQEMLDAADTLSRSIVPAIEDAPLNQRVAALAQLIDRIIKLATQLPNEEFEYIYEYELEHHVEKNTDEQEKREIEEENSVARAAYQSEESLTE